MNYSPTGVASPRRSVLAMFLKMVSGVKQYSEVFDILHRLKSAVATSDRHKVSFVAFGKHNGLSFLNRKLQSIIRHPINDGLEPLLQSLLDQEWHRCSCYQHNVVSERDNLDIRW